MHAWCLFLDRANEDNVVACWDLRSSAARLLSPAALSLVMRVWHFQMARENVPNAGFLVVLVLQKLEHELAALGVLLGHLLAKEDLGPFAPGVVLVEPWVLRRDCWLDSRSLWHDPRE